MHGREPSLIRGCRSLGASADVVVLLVGSYACWVIAVRVGATREAATVVMPDSMELQAAQVRQLASGRAAESARVATLDGPFAPPFLAHEVSARDLS